MDRAGDQEAMNIFSKILQREHATDTMLGMPLKDEGARDRRKNAMANMTGGRGFQQPKKGPKLSRGGKTRRELVADGVRKPRFLKVRP